MRNKLVMILTIMLAIIGFNGGMIVNAAEQNPAFEITDDYIIIEHVKYVFKDNKINYNNLEYELIDDNLLVAYDSEGIPNLLSIPTEEYRIKDEERIAELNASVGLLVNGSSAIPSSTVNLPYTKKLSSSQWSVTTPAGNVNIPGQKFYKVLSLKITGLSSSKSKKFDVRGIYGDISGNWYDLPAYSNYDFGVKNIVKWQNFTSTRYAKLIFGSLSGQTGYTYTMNRGTV